jgi:hypothetical protein
VLEKLSVCFIADFRCFRVETELFAAEVLRLLPPAEAGNETAVHMTANGRQLPKQENNKWYSMNGTELAIKLWGFYGDIKRY